MPIIMLCVVVAYMLFKALMAAHAIRSRRPWPWLLVIVFVPFFGPFAYFLSEFALDSSDGRAARRPARSADAAAPAPGGERRAPSRASRTAPATESQDRRAEEVPCFDRADEVSLPHRGRATGPHATDPHRLAGLATARFVAGDGAGATAALEAMRAHHAGFYRTDLHLLYARALEMAGRHEEARREYGGLCESYPGEEARCRYALLLRRTGHGEAAEAQFRAVLRSAEQRGGAYGEEQKPWADIARKALA